MADIFFWNNVPVGIYDTMSYWWQDDQHSIPLGRIPQATDVAHILSDVQYGSTNVTNVRVAEGVRFNATVADLLNVQQLGDFAGYYSSFKRFQIKDGPIWGPTRKFLTINRRERGKWGYWKYYNRWGGGPYGYEWGYKYGDGAEYGYFDFQNIYLNSANWQGGYPGVNDIAIIYVNSSAWIYGNITCGMLLA